MSTSIAYQGSEREIIEISYKEKKYSVPSILNHRYKPVKILAAGGFGMLIIAEDQTIFNRKVLIKKPILSEDKFMSERDPARKKAIQRKENIAERERKILLHGQLREINGIPTLIDWFKELDPMIHGPHLSHDGTEFKVTDYDDLTTLYIVLNYFDGIPLDEYCTKPSFTRNIIGGIRHISLYIAEILKQFHLPESYGATKIHFIYQDLKPENVLAGHGTSQLIDFGGFSYIPAINPDEDKHHRIGTPPYLAPELTPLRAGSPISPQSDIYSLGVLMKMILQISSGSDHPNPKQDIADRCIPESLVDVMEKCTMLLPQDRYQTMDELIKDLWKIPIREEGASNAQ